MIPQIIKRTISRVMMVEACGRIAHRKLGGKQIGVGIDFEGLGTKEGALIRRFLRTRAVRPQVHH